MVFVYLILILIIVDKCQSEIYAIRYDSQFYFEKFPDAPAQFGHKLSDGAVRGMLIEADPPDGCNSSLKPPPRDIIHETDKYILLVPRYNNLLNCSFEKKARVAQKAGYDAVIVYNIRSDALVQMGAENGTGINITAVFVGETSGRELQGYANPYYFIVITSESPFNIQTHLLIPFAIVVGICFIVMIAFMVVKFIKDRRRQRRHRLPTSALNKIPHRKFQKGDPYETCVICLDDYVEGEKIRILPCRHVYHSKCIDPWLTKNRRVCPICKRKVFGQDETHYDSDSDSDSDDTTPLINSGNRGTQGGTFVEQAENPLQRAVRSISQQSGAATLVTASDHHSINGDYHSVSSTSTSRTSSEVECLESSGHISDLQVHVHSPDVQSNSSRSDVHVRA